MLLKNPSFVFVIGFVLGISVMFLGSLSDVAWSIVLFRQYVNGRAMNFKENTIENNKGFDTREQSLRGTKPFSSTSRSLYDDVRVLCWIMTSPANLYKKAVHVNATWARHCNKVVFMSSENDEKFPAVGLDVEEGRENLYEKTKKAFAYVWKHHRHEADWFIKADDDTFVIVENLRYLLKHYDTNQPMYFGRRFKRIHVEKGYMSGGAGYVLSKEALKRYVQAIEEGNCNHVLTKAEDVEIGRCLGLIGVKVMDTRDGQSKDTFFPFSPGMHLLPGGIPESSWFWNFIYYPNPTGPDCCSDFLISVHYIKPSMMYALEFLTYQLLVVGVQKYSEGDRNTSAKHYSLAKQMLHLSSINFTESPP